MRLLLRSTVLLQGERLVLSQGVAQDCSLSNDLLRRLDLDYSLIALYMLMTLWALVSLSYRPAPFELSGGGDAKKGRT